jgi:hypothetical protein
MDQSESRAGDVFLRCRFKFARNSFYQSSLSCTKIAAQQDELGWDKQARKGTAESDCLLGRMSSDVL